MRAAFCCRTAKQRDAKYCAIQSKPQKSRADGPPWGITMPGRPRADSRPGGSVRYAGISVPSEAGYWMDLTEASGTPSSVSRTASRGLNCLAVRCAHKPRVGNPLATLQSEGLAVGGQRRARFRIGIKRHSEKDRTPPGGWCDEGNVRPVRRNADTAYARSCADPCEMVGVTGFEPATPTSRT